MNRAKLKRKTKRRNARAMLAQEEISRAHDRALEKFAPNAVTPFDMNTAQGAVSHGELAVGDPALIALVVECFRFSEAERDLVFKSGVECDRFGVTPAMYQRGIAKLTDALPGIGWHGEDLDPAHPRSAWYEADGLVVISGWMLERTELFEDRKEMQRQIEEVANRFFWRNQPVPSRAVDDRTDIDRRGVTTQMWQEEMAAFAEELLNMHGIVCSDSSDLPRSVRFDEEEGGHVVLYRWHFRRLTKEELDKAAAEEIALYPENVRDEMLANLSARLARGERTSLRDLITDWMRGRSEADTFVVSVQYTIAKAARRRDSAPEGIE